MNKPSAGELLQKRTELIRQIGAERAVLAQQGAALRPAALVIDKIGAGIRYVQSHLEVLLLPMAMLALWRPRRLLAFAVSGVGVWRLVQRGRRWLRP